MHIYGLDVEEVARAYPELLTYGEDGESHSLAYQRLPALLFKMTQKLVRENQQNGTQIMELAKQIISQRRQISILRSEMARFDTLTDRLNAIEQRLTEPEPGYLTGVTR
jgi:hypothetical protein